MKIELLKSIIEENINKLNVNKLLIITFIVIFASSVVIHIKKGNSGGLGCLILMFN